MQCLNIEGSIDGVVDTDAIMCEARNPEGYWQYADPVFEYDSE